jgi:Fur family ferric uptake transcriptional regulator
LPLLFPSFLDEVLDNERALRYHLRIITIINREISMGPGHKFRMTPQRRVILEELRKTTSHPTADEVYEMVRKRLPRVSLGTIYRNLEILSEHGMIGKLELGGGQRQFDGSSENHYHVRCVRCRSVSDVPVPLSCALDETVRPMSDYEILGHKLEFIGLCPQCSGRKEREPQEPGRPERGAWKRMGGTSS